MPNEIEGLLRRLSIVFALVETLEQSGKIRIQKLSYFLQERFKVPLGYEFKIHYYGPYSEELEDDLSTLKALGFIDIQAAPDGYGYHVAPKLDARKSILKEQSKYLQQIKQVIEDFAERENSSQLELDATIHFCGKLPGATNKGQVVKAVSRLKPRFDDETIEQAYDRLKSIGYL